jgi:cytoskeleton protein RodZ
MATVMASIGAHLRELRTRRGVSLDEVARTTRVAARYLVALENDAFSELPAPVFIRGFIRAYCQALGESPHDALSIYDDHAGHASRTAPPSPPARAVTAGPRPRGTLAVSFVLLVILGMALFTVALVIRPGDRLERSLSDARPEGTAATTSEPSLNPRASEPASSTPPPAAAPRTQGAAAPSAPSTPAVSSRPVVDGAPSSPPAAAPVGEPGPRRPGGIPGLEAAVGVVNSPYRLIARTTEPTWIRVRTDDGRNSEETVPPGEIREWVSDRPFTVTVGNAGGVSLELNGRALPPLGPSGAVISRLVLPPESR